MRQHLLIDADDTLWENNIYFERAFHQFCEFLDHSTLTREQVRAALDEIELVNAEIHGYGAANFGRNMIQCYQHLVERDISPADAGYIAEIARRINDHPLEIIAGVPDTLDYLAGRHDLILLTKGDPHEQQRKIDLSGLARFFRTTLIVREKDPPTYRKVVEDHTLAEHRSWMIGNSPKSDINPALKAGLGAVYVPHVNTWHLERQEFVQGERLRVVDRFADLRALF
jgi:putative hydrolase of the HAD superfamily